MTFVVVEALSEIYVLVHCRPHETFLHPINHRDLMLNILPHLIIYLEVLFEMLLYVFF